jgi:predicted ATPase
MKIESLQINNFRGIRDLSMSNLGGMVIIAGQNGSGKSCIFDAIRLLKSIYGGYQANEWQQWMGEFQINLSNHSSDFLPIFNDKTKELVINCDFRLSEEERKFIIDHDEELLREYIWRSLIPDAYSWGGQKFAMFASQYREREPEVSERVQEARPRLVAELSEQTARGSFSIRPGEFPKISDSLTLSVAFSSRRPQEIGVIDYHGAQRHYGRESVQGISLNLDVNNQQFGQHALYNYANKYNNIKSEMAATYVKEILAEQAGVPRASQASLTNTLKDLFEAFFPDKKFLGPTPTDSGLLTFPVETSNGGQHDLDDLSSGEKEILYGYLRMKNSAPRFSVILLDEPELHLNPRLIRSLPQFYRKNLGENLQNQLWLVTHSDALLREVVGRDAYTVFHMLPSRLTPQGESQLKFLSATADLDVALSDLVGDLAAYRPGGKIVILEGGGDTDFDKMVVSRFFPELLECAQLVSGTNKTRVQGLHQILENASQSGAVPFTFFSITDRDSGPKLVGSAGTRALTWDVYHIENYLLVPKCISSVLSALRLDTNGEEDQIWDELRECAKRTIPLMVRHELTSHVNTLLVGAIQIQTDPRLEQQFTAVLASVESSITRICNAQTEYLSEALLATKETELRDKYTTSVSNGNWVSEFRGREILKQYVSYKSLPVRYEIFRNLLLSQMSDDGYKPEGMREVVKTILTA